MDVDDVRDRDFKVTVGTMNFSSLDMVTMVNRQGKDTQYKDTTVRHSNHDVSLDPDVPRPRSIRKIPPRSSLPTMSLPQATSINHRMPPRTSWHLRHHLSCPCLIRLPPLLLASATNQTGIPRLGLLLQNPPTLVHLLQLALILLCTCVGASVKFCISLLRKSQNSS